MLAGGSGLSSFCWAPVVARNLGGGGTCERGGRLQLAGEPLTGPSDPGPAVTGAHFPPSHPGQVPAGREEGRPGAQQQLPHRGP